MALLLLMVVEPPLLVPVPSAALTPEAIALPMALLLEMVREPAARTPVPDAKPVAVVAVALPVALVLVTVTELAPELMPLLVANDIVELASLNTLLSETVTPFSPLTPVLVLCDRAHR